MSLYLLSRSPWERQDYKTVLSLSRAQADQGIEAAVLTIQDAVVAEKKAPPDYQELVRLAKEAGVRFYVLSADLSARGLAPSASEPVDYDGFLELILKYKTVV
ncbi:MAG: sulfurtransferase complex subunit TusB [Bacillota bacterium]